MDFLIKKIDYLSGALLNSKLYFIRLPLLIGFFGFLETVGIFGYFIPMEILSVSYFAFIHNRLWLFLFASFVFFLGIFLGLLAGYFIGVKFYKKLITKLEKKFPALKEYFADVEGKIDKYHLLAFPILINLGITRPIMAMHLGARHYNFGKFVIGSIIASLSFVLPRIIVGYLVGVFGKIILEKFKIGLKYVIIFVIVLVFLAFVVDFFRGEKELK